MMVFIMISTIALKNSSILVLQYICVTALAKKVEIYLLKSDVHFIIFKRLVYSCSGLI